VKDISKNFEDGTDESTSKEEHDGVTAESCAEDAAGESEPAAEDEQQGDSADQTRDRSWIAPGSMRFIIVFVTFVVVVFLTYNHYEKSEYMAGYMRILASQVGALLRFLTRDSWYIEGPKVYIDNAGIEVIPACGAVPSMSIFTAAVLAFPARVWKKALALLLGLPFLYVVNVVRLTCLAYIRVHFPLPVFNFTHIYVWQTLFIVFVVVLWFIWINFVTAEKGLRHFLLHIWQASRLGFALRFVCFGALFLAAFVIMLPVYAWVVVHVAGFCLQMIVGADIRGVLVEGAYGIGSFALNDAFFQKVLGVRMVIEYGQKSGGMLAAELAFTLTPFVALVAATARVKWRRRVTVAGFGLGILLLWQLLMLCTFFVSAVYFGVTQDAFYVRTMAFVNAVLPFLMWFVMLVMPQIPGWPKRLSQKDSESGNEIEELCTDTGDGGAAAGGCDEDS